jgi:hypothetical protein
MRWQRRDVDAVARDLVREVGAEEEEHVALLLLHEDLVVADPVDRVREHPDELLARLRPDVRDVLRAGRADGGDDVVDAREARGARGTAATGLRSSHFAEAERHASRLPKTDLLTAPGIEPPTFRMTSRSARPMVAFARPLWPRQE